MKIGKQARRDAKALFRSCLVNGLVDDDRVRRAVAEVVQRKPRGYVAILQHFQRLLRLDVERRSARVESATPLGENLRADVLQNLSRRYGSGLIVQFAENPALVGGLRVRVGSDVIDGSVAGRLAALADSL